MSELKSKTINGFIWSFLSQFGRQVLTLIITIVLARLLTPSEFGLLASVTAITGFAAIFTEMGYGAALVQKKDASQVDYSSVFWVNIIIGVFLTLLFLLGSGLIVKFYDNPDLKFITIILSFNFLLNSTTIVQRIKLVKNIQFKMLAKIELISILIAGIFAILLAYNDFGVYSLVVQLLLISVVTNIILWYNSKWRPSFILNKNSIRALNKFSVNLMGNQIFAYWTKNIDNLLIGKYLGTDALGLYSRSYSLLAYRVNSISKVLSRVMFPTLSSIQEDNQRIKTIYLRVLKAICIVIFPIIIGLYFTADNLIFLLFGEKWIQMIPVFKALSIFGFGLAIGSVHGNIYLAKGKTALQLKVGIFFKSLSILAIIIGLNWGILGVAYCLGIVVLLSQFPQISIAGKLINMSLIEVLKSLYKIAIISFILGLLVWQLDVVLGNSISMIWLIIIQVIFGVLSYAILAYYFEKPFVIEVISVVKSQRKS